MRKRVLSLGLVQHACSTRAEENLARIEDGIRAAADQGAQLILLQELHNSQYFCQTEDPEAFDLAEEIPGATTEFLGKIARDKGVVIVGSLFERRAAGVYHNTAVCIERNGSIAGLYRKMHIPDDPGYYEKYYFTPGDLGFNPIQTSLGVLGILVCWDQWYPEAARLMALAGAEILLYPTAIGWEPTDHEAEKGRQLEAWLTIQRGHAIANGIPLAACNRIGHEEDPSGRGRGIDFWGHSFVAGPFGEYLARETGPGPAVTLAEVTLGDSESVRRTWPFFRDRRCDAYADLQRRYRD